MANRKNFTDRKLREDRYQYNFFFSQLKRVVWKEEYEEGDDAII